MSFLCESFVKIALRNLAQQTDKNIAKISMKQKSEKGHFATSLTSVFQKPS